MSARRLLRGRPILASLGRFLGPVGQRIDDLYHGGFPGVLVAVPVCRHELLVDVLSHLDADVIIGGEQVLETFSLSWPEQIQAGMQQPAGLVERIMLVASMPMNLLLDPLTGHIQSITCKLDDMERVHDRDRVRDGFSRSGLEPDKPVHRHDLDPLTKGQGLLFKPGLKTLAWSGPESSQLAAGAPPCRGPGSDQSLQ